MQNIIVLKMTKKKKLSVGITDTITSTKVAWVLRSVNFAKMYKWPINNNNLNVVKKLW